MVDSTSKPKRWQRFEGHEHGFLVTGRERTEILRLREKGVVFEGGGESGAN